MAQTDHIVFLEHRLNGLAKGTVLISLDTMREWEIVTRILSFHTMDIHRVFENETINLMHLNFVSMEKREKSILRTQQEEVRNIYQYNLKSMGHSMKPRKGERSTYIKWRLKLHFAPVG